VHHQTELGAPLLRVITELRLDVDRLIDEEVRRLGMPPRREAKAIEIGAGRELMAAAPARTRPGGSTSGRENGQPGPRAAGPRPPEGPGDDDPSRRLDALAKHLDDRMRRAAGRPVPAEAS
jgi:hypothetical protein